MKIPPIFAAALAARQLGTLLPSDYCTPECPSCRDSISSWTPDSAATECTPNSDFILNCGTCQQCILTFAITNGTQETSDASVSMLGNVLNWCSNTTASAAVENLATQAQKISVIGEQLASKTTMSAIATTTSGSGTQPTSGVPIPTPTGQSLASMNSSNLTATGNNTPQATGPPTTTAAPSLNKSWVAGPVIGSCLGIGTVFIVIYFTRRKQNQEMTIETQPKNFKIDDDAASQSTQGKAQLHADSVSVKELENTEVQPPVELPVPEPVGSELITPKHGSFKDTDDWPLPLSPLPALFAMTEMRDEKAGLDDSPRHDTFYHP